MDKEALKNKLLQELDSISFKKKGKKKKKKPPSAKPPKVTEESSFKAKLQSIQTVVFDNPEVREKGPRRERVEKKKILTRDQIEAELKTARYDVIKLASSAGEKLTHQGKEIDAEELLAIQLGAKPPKKGPTLNYVALMEQRKKEKAAAKEQEEFQKNHYKLANKKSSKSSKSKKGKGGGGGAGSGIVKVRNVAGDKREGKGSRNKNNKTKLHNFKKQSLRSRSKK